MFLAVIVFIVSPHARANENTPCLGLYRICFKPSRTSARFSPLREPNRPLYRLPPDQESPRH